MGFTTGLLGGITLTTTLTYLALATHRQIRTNQALALRNQAQSLNNIVDPPPLTSPPVAREVRAGLIETGKDRWNREIESLVRRVQTTDWHAVRDDAEEKIVAMYRRARDSVQT